MVLSPALRVPASVRGGDGSRGRSPSLPLCAGEPGTAVQDCGEHQGSAHTSGAGHGCPLFRHQPSILGVPRPANWEPQADPVAANSGLLSSYHQLLEFCYSLEGLTEFRKAPCSQCDVIYMDIYINSYFNSFGCARSK